ncbi:MAG: ferritin family protein [Candidatus Lernaella stagnicola]|nr:ferritin family protein [Candidatus Lernaella stagnicola]
MKFSAVEICKIGVEVERNGYRFYTMAQKKTDSEDLAKLFGELAQAEQMHERTYKQILERLELAEGGEEDCCFDQEYSTYLQALANSRVFTAQRTVEKVLEGIESPEDLVFTAMGFEKDAILWLSEMRNWVEETEKPIIDEFIAYEKEHLSFLQRVLATLDKK